MSHLDDAQQAAIARSLFRERPTPSELAAKRGELFETTARAAALSWGCSVGEARVSLAAFIQVHESVGLSCVACGAAVTVYANKCAACGEYPHRGAERVGGFWRAWLEGAP